MSNIKMNLNTDQLIKRYQEKASKYTNSFPVEDFEYLDELLDRLQINDPEAFYVVYSLLKENARLRKDLIDKKDRTIINEKKG